ncbi:DUF4352 domain-containing protein [Gorillibacterium massiliense]|uniref:DUF4352 domain-containing protein n=1 Tax=Gorillibacterium massiliense TaxID=1280390 RepID=UPI0004B20635|nr:DUF4352 domain-containing protein [Gorillibacterium massiliense]
MRKIVGMFLLAGLIISAAGCGSSSNKAEDKPATAEASQPASAAPEAAVENTAAGQGDTDSKTYKIGETAELFDLQVTVDKVESAASYNEQILKDGTEFVLVHVTLKNAGKEQKNYNSASFNLLSSSGSPDLSVTTLDQSGELHIGQLAPGETVSGVLPFEHPVGDAVKMLEFHPNMMSERVLRFDLK